MIAPAGYGKTVLLSQWASDERRETFWITIDERDDDPVRLIGRIAAALDASEPLGEEVLAPISGPRPDLSRIAVPRLCEAIAARDPVVDPRRRAPASRALLDALAALAEGFPDDSRLIVAGRSEPDIGIGRLRVAGGSRSSASTQWR